MPHYVPLRAQNIFAAPFYSPSRMLNSIRIPGCAFLFYSQVVHNQLPRLQQLQVFAPWLKRHHSGETRSGEHKVVESIPISARPLGQGEGRPGLRRSHLNPRQLPTSPLGPGEGGGTQKERRDERCRHRDRGCIRPCSDARGPRVLSSPAFKAFAV